MSESSSIEVRQIRPNDEAALAAFFCEAYGKRRGRYKYPARWKWLYRDNPFTPEGFGLPGWIAISGDKIVGHTGAMFSPCKIGEDSRVVAWSVDTIVLPEYRGLGLGKRLQKANQDTNEVFISLSMSPANRAIKIKNGAIEGPQARLFIHTDTIDMNHLFKGIRHRLQARLGALFGKTVFCMLIATGVPFAYSKYVESRLLRCQRREVDTDKDTSLDFEYISGRFEPIVDILWQKWREPYNFAIERFSCYLNWKYIDQPQVKYECFLANDGGRAVGAIVLRLCKKPEPQLGVISEVLCSVDSPNVLRSLISFAQKWLYGQKVTGIYCASSSTAQDRTLINLGFLQVSSESACIYDRTGKANNYKSSWHALLSKGDHDWDQFPLTRQISLSEIRKIFKQTSDI